MKKLFCIALAIFICLSVLSFSAGAARERELHWYCTRNMQHRQPVLPPELAFAEELGGYYIDRAHGDDVADRVVYLTFDAGYENGNVEKILNTLQEKEVPAAFFVLSHLVEANTALVLRMQNEGHLVCNHTARHKNLSAATAEAIVAELQALEDVMLQKTGKTCAPYFRPPEGSFSRNLLQVASGNGYKTIFWSFAYADWDNNAQPSAEAALEKITANLHNGAVLLLHPTSATNAEILPRLIDHLRAEGYRFGTLDELCAK